MTGAPPAAWIHAPSRALPSSGILRAMTTPGDPSLSDPSALCAAAEVLFHKGDAEARAAGDAALAAALAGGSDALTARAHQLLGEIDYDELAYGSALVHLDAAVALREAILGPADDLTRASLAYRAVVLQSEHRLADAARDTERAASGRGLPAGPDDAAENAIFWVTLACAQHGSGNTAEAKAILEAVIAAEPTGKVWSLALANAHVHLATILEEQGDRERARRCDERVVAIRREVIGEPSLRVAFGLSSLSNQLLGAERLDEGRAMAHASAVMLEACGRQEHPRASLVYLGVAVAEVISGNGAASERWLARSIALETRTFGADHPSTGSVLLTAARTYTARGFHGRAAELAQKAAAVFQPRLATHAEAFSSSVSVGYQNLRLLERTDAAGRWLESVIAGLDRVKPPPDALGPALCMLGESYLAAGRLAKSEAALRRSLPIAERVHGGDSEEVRAVLVILAALLAKQRRTEEARAIEDRAQRIADAIEDRSLSPLRSRRIRGLA
jgi:tetratricopeptide (TPR) repeat protein